MKRIIFAGLVLASMLLNGFFIYRWIFEVVYSQALIKGRQDVITELVKKAESGSVQVDIGQGQFLTLVPQTNAKEKSK